MQTAKNKQIQLILLVLSSIISLTILIYFWAIHIDFTQRINIYIMILALLYITIEMIKKNLFKKVSPWNRIYYIGLFAVVAPIALENKISWESIKWINRLGIFFLLIPLMLEAKLILNSKND